MKRQAASYTKLLEVIRAALDCESHFEKPEIVEKDPYYKIGKGAIVICETCVTRLRKALGLKPGEPVPTHYQMFPGEYGQVLKLTTGEDGKLKTEEVKE